MSKLGISQTELKKTIDDNAEKIEMLKKYRARKMNR